MQTATALSLFLCLFGLIALSSLLLLLLLKLLLKLLLQGKLKSQLGVGGYNPVGQGAQPLGQSTGADDEGGEGKQGGGGGAKKQAPQTPEEKMKSACALLERSRVGRLGETAMKTLQK